QHRQSHGEGRHMVEARGAYAQIMSHDDPAFTVLPRWPPAAPGRGTASGVRRDPIDTGPPKRRRSEAGLVDRLGRIDTPQAGPLDPTADAGHPDPAPIP